MAVTIMETLQNAYGNLNNLRKIPTLLPHVEEQLGNAIELLKKGYNLSEEVEPLLEKYGAIENVPKNKITEQ